jgi:hypothetical protein
MRADMTVAYAAALQANPVRPAIFVSIAFADNTVFVWSGSGTVSPPGPSADPLNTFPYGSSFVGLGNFGSISSIPSTTDVIAQSISVRLSGIPANLVAETINEVRLTSECSIWLGLFDINNNLIDHPIRLFGPGQADVPTISDSGETCTLEITFENALISLQLAVNRRFTDVDQQIDYPGDTGMAYVTIEQNLFIQFPFYAETDSSGSAPPTENGVTITPASPLILPYGATQQMTAMCEFVNDPRYNGDPGVENVTSAGLWVSSDTNVCFVSNGTGAVVVEGDYGTGGGVVTGVGPGIATITFTFGTVAGSCTVIVP